MSYDKRDQLGHFVAPPSQQGHPCHHACCRGKRPHPKGEPVKLDRKYLRTLSDEQVYQELERYANYSDEQHQKGYLTILAEAESREERAQRAAASKERIRDRRQRETREYRDEVYRQWLTAENGIQGGVLLNKAGIRAGINERSLFSGPQRRVNKYASDELKEWFATHPRMTRQEWDARNRRERGEERRIGLGVW